MLASEVDHIMDTYFHRKFGFKTPCKTYNFIINGTAGSGKDTFIELCSRFTKVTNTSSVDLIREMSDIVGLSDNRQFLCDLKKLTYKYTTYITDHMDSCLKENHLNFLHIREEKEVFNRRYKNFNKILIVNPCNKSRDLSTSDTAYNFNQSKYTHVILNTELSYLPYSAHDFVNMYVK